MRQVRRIVSFLCFVGMAMAVFGAASGAYDWIGAGIALWIIGFVVAVVATLIAQEEARDRRDQAESPDQTKRGFTLVEFVIVVAILCIMAGVIVPSFLGLMGREAHDGNRTELDEGTVTTVTFQPSTEWRDHPMGWVDSDGQWLPTRIQLSKPQDHTLFSGEWYLIWHNNLPYWVLVPKGSGVREVPILPPATEPKKTEG